MADLNRVALVGRLTRDAELRYTASGLPVCNFSVAVNRRRKNGDEWLEEASFFDIVLWGRQGEALNQYLVKGKQIAIDGELRQNRWEQDGQPRSRVEVVANTIQLLGAGQGQGSQPRQYNESQQQQGYAPSAYQKRPETPNRNDEYVPNIGNSDLDDIPF